MHNAMHISGVTMNHLLLPYTSFPVAKLYFHTRLCLLSSNNIYAGRYPP